MKKWIFITFSFLFIFMLSLSPSANDEAFIIGGGGASGQGTNDNGWVVRSIDDTLIYDVQGLRIYLVSSATGVPIESKNVVDITNSNVTTSNIYNGADNLTGKKRTKYDYKVKNTLLKLGNIYNRIVIADTEIDKIPLIIPWDGYPDSTTRINKLKQWLLNRKVADELCKLIGSSFIEVCANEWYLAIEPIAYFRYNGMDFALTATECAMYNKHELINGRLYNYMYPLTHNNLPLSMFLDVDLFKGNLYEVEKMRAWRGSYTANASDSDIINSLGIGYINYNDPEGKTKDEDIPPPPPPPPDPVGMWFSIEANPKEYEVKGTPGIPVTIGKDVTVKVDLKQDESVRNDWRKRLEGVSTVDVYMVLKQTPENRSLTCMTNSTYSGSVLNGTKITLSTSDFINKLLYNTYTFKDSTGVLPINPGETKTYNYTFNMTVKFKESPRYNTGGNIISIDALNPEGNVFDSDYASFFREADPPEYVTYTSTPVAYSEIKQGTIGNEQFEAMAGTPTTRALYFGAGGSEFIVDFKAEYKKNNTAKRTYRVHYDGAECEFKETDNSKTHSLGGVTVNTHTGGSYVAATTWSGNHGHSQNAANCGTCGAVGYNSCTLNTSAYDTALAAAINYANQINGTVLTWTSGSDRQTRTKSGWGANSITTQNDTSSNARGASGGSGCLHGSCSIVGTPTNPHTHSGGNCTAGSSCTNAHAWRIEVRFSVPQDVICGPCCRHDLPAINDTWTQEITYDYFDAVKMSVWKIEQGYLNGLSTITGGTNAVLTGILQGNPNIFHNIANTETSIDGRFRYSLQAGQHDTVVWNMGTRTNKCDKQSEIWGTGIKYSTSSYPHQSGYLVNTASAKDKLTAEYAKFKEYRETPVIATVISDFLILQTSSGDQSVLYFQKQSNSVQSQQDFNYVSFAKAEGWDSNSKSAANWSTGHINHGSYNGKYSSTSTKYNGTGNGSTVSTIFDSDPAGTVSKPSRPSRPSSRLLIAKYDIDIKDTIPNNDYKTGTAKVFWELTLNYNPDGLTQKYSIASQSLFGGKAGHVKAAPYSPNHTKINDIVIHNPVSSEYAMVLATDGTRDQRTSSASWAMQKSLADTECPGNPAECEHRYLNCRYTGTTAHTASCYSATTPKTLNAHDHTLACIDTVKMQEAIQTIPGSKTFSYSGNVQSFVTPVAGTYTFEVWGAQGGSRTGGGTGGLGGYSKGTYTLPQGQTINIYVGGQPTGTSGGWNGGGSAGGAAFGGGGGTDIRIGGTALGNRVIVAGGGGGAQAGNGGTGGGTSGGNGAGGSTNSAGKGGLQSAGGAGGKYSYDAVETIITFNYTGNYQTYTVPKTGKYTFKVWGAQGGTSNGGLGGYSTGTYNLTEGQTIYIYVGGQPVDTNGGWNGGGSTTNIGGVVSSGGGASDIRIGGTSVSYRKIVAGGGGGAGHFSIGSFTGGGDTGVYQGGIGGGINGGNGYGDYATSGTGGGNSVSGSSIGTNGYGGGGGGGYNGGSAGSLTSINDSNWNGKFYGSGGGGSSYTAEVTDGLTQSGVRSGNGYIEIITPSGVTTYEAESGSLGQGGKGAAGSDNNFGGGGGGGYYGGGGSVSDSSSINDAGGAGGSGYIGGVTGGSTQSGVNSGNGKAVISYDSGEYKGTSWGLVDLAEIISGGTAAPTAEWIAKQPTNSIIFGCGGMPYNRHVCNTSCSHDSILICNEPHHEGEHHDISNTTCWSACNDNSKHANKTTSAAGNIGYFINLDWGFQIYFSTTGDFYQNGAYGISQLTAQRGKGYTNNMQTSEWIAKKRVKFGYDVIYCGITGTVNANGSQHGNSANGSDSHKHTSSCVLYKADTWIDLYKDYELFNFYCVGANNETAASSVIFEVTAINAPNLENDNDLPTNRYRNTAFEALHGGTKRTYIDIIGRIGNLVMEDTDDWRFMNLFKTGVSGTGIDDYFIQGIVKKVDSSSKNYVLANDSKDIRGLPLNATYKQDVYGLLSWIRSKTLTFPLSPSKNNINALKNEPLRFGYSVLLDIETLGKEYHTVEVFPSYYYYDTATKTAYPVDAYILAEEGYKPINLFDNNDIGKVYPFKYYLDWDKEAARRNVTANETSLTQSLSGIYPTGQNYSVGNAQYLNFGERARTYIGSNSTLGVNQNIGGLISNTEFQKSIKRWHFTLGLPSSAVVVDAGANPNETNIKKYKNGNGVLLMTAVIRAKSNLYTVEYEVKSDNTFKLNDISYPLPSGLPTVIAVYNGVGKSAIDDLQISKTH